MASTRTAAPDDVLCPHCGACNHGAAALVWKVADERGAHYQCDCCGTPWPIHHGAHPHNGKGRRP